MITNITEILNIVFLSASMALVYGITAFMKSNSDEVLDKYKLGGTLVTSFIISAMVIMTDNSIAQEAFEVQLATYGGLTIVTENILKIITRKIMPKLQ